MSIITTAVTSFKAKLPALKADFTRAETYVKTLVVTCAAGAAADVVKLFSTADHEALLFTQAGIVILKHTFLYGAASALLGLFVKSPLTATAAPATPPAAQ
jgi:hypothetical protein